MHIYFVRHGETILNRQKIHQSPNTPLSERGKEQAHSVAELLRSVNPDLLLTSEYTRARETADIIGAQVGLVPIVEDNLYEVVRPSILHGHSHYHPRTFAYVAHTLLFHGSSEARYLDAENFADIEARVRRALRDLEVLKNTHKSVVVVSHTIFIHCMIAYLCERRLWGLWRLMLAGLHMKQMQNTGIIHVEYTGNTVPNTCAWRVVDGV